VHPHYVAKNLLDDLVGEFTQRTQGLFCAGSGIEFRANPLAFRFDLRCDDIQWFCRPWHFPCLRLFRREAGSGGG